MQSEEEILLIDLTQKLLDCIAAGDWNTYCELCDPSLTCFEPEAVGNLISGLEFHRFYFDIAKNSTAPVQTTIANAHVRMMNDVAVVSYLRVMQQGDSPPQTRAFEETRVWQKTNSGWMHVHFHRSGPQTWNV